MKTGHGSTMPRSGAQSHIDQLKSKLVETGPDLGLYLALGKAQVDRGDTAGAAETFALAAEHAPESEEARIYLAGTQRMAGNLDAAEHTLRAAWRDLPASEFIAAELGLLILAHGLFSEAQAIFRQALEMHPKSRELRIGAARAALEAGELSTARSVVMDALEDVAVDPVITPLRAEVERRQGHPEAAFDQARLALNQDPSNEAAAKEAVASLLESGQLNRAVESLDELEGKGLLSDASRLELLQIILDQGQFNLAIGYFETFLFSRITELHPAFLAPAEQVAARVIAVEPRDGILAWLEGRAALPDARPGLKIELADLLLIRGELDRAAETARAALKQDPNNPEAWACLADAHTLGGDLISSIEAAETALRLEPTNERANMARAFAALYEDHGDDAVQFADLAVASSALPEHPIAKRGELKLRLGRFAGGWADFARRRPDLWMAPKRHFAQLAAPSLASCIGKRVFVWAEWGLGEQIMLAPLAQELSEHGVQVTLECQSRLQSLAASSFPNLDVRAEHSPTILAAEGFDSHVRLSDLGAWFRPDVSAFPKHDGYLKPSAALLGKAQSALDASCLKSGAKRIGISWASTGVEAPLKSLPCGEFVNALAHDAVELINLQHGAPRIAADEFGSRVIALDDPELHPAADLEGLAAVIRHLDHVVTTSNTVAHIAGALNVPFDVLVPTYRHGLWHWLDHKKTSPWYPSATVHFFSRKEEAEDILKAIAKEQAPQ